MISAGINLDDNESVEKTTEKIESFYRFVQGTVFENIEDIEYEFKEPKGTNPLNTIKDTVAKYVCAFLNANGGRILYGITDKERIIKGITATPQQIDEIKRVIYDKCKGVNPGISPDQIQIYFHELFNKDNKKLENQFVLEVVVPTPIDKSIIHFISNGKELYVRVNGSSRKLEGAEIVSYTLNKYRIQLNNKNEWK
ncbi:helix-turn-helix domain-containing protein [Parageobacillus thermoglucosidasius]|uniref:AlbA family DNA-binding domain-containing protein n=1 Tax=Parageobacillus thermoglucosidasius TaxID=1426 RepID=UPI00241E47AB|nr:ATP-binding protein [Parageobacillus thermoglucosidasius]